MIAAFVLFLILAIWGIIDSEIYATEAIILFVLWGICLAVFLLYAPGFGFAVGGVALIDIYLLLKLVGNPRV